MLNARKQEGSYLYVSQYIETGLETQTYDQYDSAALHHSGYRVCGKRVK